MKQNSIFTIKNIGNIFALVLSTSEPNRLPHSASIAGRFIFLAVATPPAGNNIITPPCSKNFFGISSSFHIIF